MRIGIAGIGGIGSNVARILAQAGYPAIRVVDFDRVEASNLNRQFYTQAQVGRLKTHCLRENLLAIRPEMDVVVDTHRIRAGQSVALFNDCGMVVEGFDDKALKKMLIEELAQTGKPVVSASGIAGPDMGGIQVRQLGNCRIVGDFQSDQAECLLFPPKIAVVAGHMAAIALELTGEESWKK